MRAMACSDNFQWHFLARISLIALLLGVGDARPNRPSIPPPEGSSYLAEFVGVGVQIYKCLYNSSGALSWKPVGASANLSANETIAARHYFLSTADANGGKPTWAHWAEDGTIDSTVTGRVLKSISDPDPANASTLLLQATSHSGAGIFSWASYIYRYSPTGGGAPQNSACRKHFQIQRVPYTALYIFYSQNQDVDQSTLPEPIQLPPGTQPVKSFYGSGYQHYQYNGSSWVMQNATANLSYFPGSQVVGQHYFLPPTSDVGRPTWSTYLPTVTSVTGRVKSRATVSPDSSDWLLLDVVVQSPSTNDTLSSVQRVATVGGLPPAPSPQAKAGDLYPSPYTAIYRFYSSVAP